LLSDQTLQFENVDSARLGPAIGGKRKIGNVGNKDREVAQPEALP